MRGRYLVEQRLEGGSELQLWENIIDGRLEYEIVINGVFIMASYNSLSSKKLVTCSMARIEKSEDVSILIGGLGMGFTAAQACSDRRISHIDVVELEPAVIEWNESFFKEYNGDCLNDSRLNIIKGDFYQYVLDSPRCYDIITMDIDNGPMMIVRQENSRVYHSKFFEAIRKILNRRGVFAIWSCCEDAGLAIGFNRVFGNCEVEEVFEEHGGRQVPYYLYFALAGEAV